MSLPLVVFGKFYYLRFGFVFSRMLTESSNDYWLLIATVKRLAFWLVVIINIHFCRLHNNRTKKCFRVTNIVFKLFVTLVFTHVQCSSNIRDFVEFCQYNSTSIGYSWFKEFSSLYDLSEFFGFIYLVTQKVINQILKIKISLQSLSFAQETQKFSAEQRTVPNL